MAETPTDLLPPSWIASWSEDGTDITIPLASLAEVTAAEADALTGDIRKCLWGICEEFYNAYTNMATASRPSKMTLVRSQSVNNTTNEITKSYNFQFILDQTGIDVAAE